MAQPAEKLTPNELQERRSDEAVRAVLRSRMQSEAFVSEEKMTQWFESLGTDNPKPMPTPDTFD